MLQGEFQILYTDRIQVQLHHGNSDQFHPQRTVKVCIGIPACDGHIPEHVVQ